MTTTTGKRVKKSVLQEFADWLAMNGGVFGTFEITHSKTAFVIRRTSSLSVKKVKK